MTDQPRGVRNKNPGNIERNTTKWQGMADDQSGDPRFIVFKDAKWGIRAIAKIMMTYQSADGCKTIGQLIGRWAPPGGADKNPTTAYAANVARAVGRSLGDATLGVNDPVDVDSMAVMKPLVSAIIAQECSGYAYPDAVLLDGLHQAGVADAPPKPLATQGTFVTKAVGTGGVGIATCIEACKAVINDPTKVHDLSNQVKDAAGQLDPFSGVAIFDHVKTAMLTVGGGLLLASLALSVLKQRAS